MLYFSLKSNIDRTKFLLTSTNYKINTNGNISITAGNRKLSQVGSASYVRSLRRAFARAKALSFFNPDLIYFITFTYKENNLDYKSAMADLKVFLKKERRDSVMREHKIKYIYVFERQKRGAIHIHMISNTPFTTHVNQNGHLSLDNWVHGFTSVLAISDFDTNFRPYLYLLKYMSKAQRVGKSFIHTSRTFDKTVSLDYDQYINHLVKENLLYSEDFAFYIEGTQYRIDKGYYHKKV